MRTDRGPATTRAPSLLLSVMGGIEGSLDGRRAVEDWPSRTYSIAPAWLGKRGSGESTVPDTGWRAVEPSRAFEGARDGMRIDPAGYRTWTADDRATVRPAVAPRVEFEVDLAGALGATQTVMFTAGQSPSR